MCDNVKKKMFNLKHLKIEYSSIMKHADNKKNKYGVSK